MRTISVLMGTDYGYMRQILYGISEYIDKHPDYDIDMAPITSEALHRVQQIDAVGVIVHAVPAKWHLAPELLCRPVVTIFEFNSIGEFSNVTVDNVASGRLMAEHLLACGCRRLGFVSIPHDHDLARLKGFCEVLDNIGIEPVVYKGPIKAAVGVHWAGTQWQAKLCDWLKSQSTPLGLGVSNVICAHAVVDSCRRLGIRVPDDVVVVGLSGDDLLERFSRPSLSCVQVSARNAGYEAASLLVNRLESKEKSWPREIVMLPSGVVVRGSSDVLMSADEDVAAAAKYIRQHVANGSLDIERVAAQTSLSRRSLERRFRRLVGRSVHEEIQRVRLARAKQLLIETDLPLTDVARQAGVRTPDRLGKLFRQMEKMSPSAFREKNQPSRYY